MRRSAELLVLLVIAAGGYAQSLSDQITVSAVDVPVYVTRYNGEAVQGLTRDDFELFVNGKPHTIDYFDAIVDTGPAAAGEQRPELSRRRLFVLLMNPTAHQDHSQLTRAQADAVKFVDEAPPGDVFAVAVTQYRRSIQFVVPFTSDRVAVRRAIATLNSSRAGDAFGLATLESERALFGVAERGHSISDSRWRDAPGVPGRMDLLLTGPLRDDDERAARGSSEGVDPALITSPDSTIDALGELADRLAPISGIKHVVMIGSANGGGGLGSLSRLVHMHKKCRAAGVIVNIIANAPAAGAFGVTAEGPLASDPLNMSWQLALDTGGTVAPTLRSLRKMQNVTYVLGFSPPKHSGKWSSIKVRLRNSPFGTLVRHRLGYSADPSADRGDGLFLADVLMNDIPQNGISVDLAIEARSGDVTLIAQVPGAEVLALGRGGTTMLDVFLYVFDANDVVASWWHARINVDHAKGRDFLSAHPYTVRQAVHLGPGRYSAKALLRILDRNVTGFDQASFEIPGS